MQQLMNQDTAPQVDKIGAQFNSSAALLTQAKSNNTVASTRDAVFSGKQDILPSPGFAWWDHVTSQNQGDQSLQQLPDAVSIAKLLEMTDGVAVGDKGAKGVQG